MMSFPGSDLTGKVAIITGGGTGIGAATALLLAQLGADVVIASRSQDTLEQRAAEIKSETGQNCLAIPTDVRDEQQVAKLIQNTIDELGRVDILINNAGGTRLRPLKDLSTDHWQRSFALNVDAAFYCTREVGAHFRQQGSGAIVNVSSMAGVNGTLRGAHYASSKAALQMFTRVAAAEWGPCGVRVNCVAPGMVLSDIATEHLRQSNIDIDEGTRQFPLRRAGTPEDVARVIAFLASDAAAYVTGETIAVNGGPVLGGTLDEA